MELLKPPPGSFNSSLLCDTKIYAPRNSIYMSVYLSVCFLSPIFSYLKTENYFTLQNCEGVADWKIIGGDASWQDKQPNSKENRTDKAFPQHFCFVFIKISSYFVQSGSVVVYVDLL